MILSLSISLNDGLRSSCFSSFEGAPRGRSYAGNFRRSADEQDEVPQSRLSAYPCGGKSGGDYFAAPGTFDPVSVRVLSSGAENWGAATQSFDVTEKENSMLGMAYSHYVQV